ncbi:MAG: ion transporter [Phycisphaerales bacterium]|nr:ion transporter [Phycisphaerales bacterium]
MTARAAVHRLLEASPPTRAAAAVRAALAGLIVINVAAVLADSVRDVHAVALQWLRAIEWVSVAVFSAEYLLRLWAAPEQPRFGLPFGRLRWALTPSALVDLLAVLPSLLAMASLDLRTLRLVRLARLFRIAKLGRYSLAVQTLFAVLRSKAADLLSLLFVLVILLVCASTLMFHLEGEAQPDVFSSIPATMWWGIVTLTTIGYGDMAPVTAAGRALGGVVAVLGIGMFALPAGLLGAAFVDELGKLRAARGGSHDGHAGHADGAHCPHCGKALGR